jgi:hypothetical protein
MVFFEQEVSAKVVSVHVTFSAEWGARIIEVIA